MKPKTLLTAALLCGAPIAIASAGALNATSAPAGTADLAASADDYEALVKEFDAVSAEFDEKLKEADKATRREMRANTPVKQYWPRFTAMSEAGEGRASLWLANNIRENRDIRSKERGATLVPLYESLVENHVDAEWFMDAMKSMMRNARFVGPEKALAMFDTIAESAKADETKAASLYYAMSMVAKDEKKAAAYLARIEKDFGNTVWATAAKAAVAKPEDSEVGKVAPTFVGKTIDGFQFSLEDYRGKVVALDFYGFW